MKFHNTSTDVYRARMILPVPRTLLARLRSSARLAVLVLLVFAMKVGTAAACAKHDFSDIGRGGGTETSHAVVEALPSDAGDLGSDNTRLGHAGTCNHCGCHHAAAVVHVAHIPLAETAGVLAFHTAGLPPSASPSMDLRPPIV